MRQITYAQAGLEAFTEEMRRDDTVFDLSTDGPKPLVDELVHPAYAQLRSRKVR